MSFYEEEGDKMAFRDSLFLRGLVSMNSFSSADMMGRKQHMKTRTATWHDE
jgi:hypothetical protein